MKSFEPFDAVFIVTKFILNGTEYLPFFGSPQALLFTGNWIQKQTCGIPNHGGF